jgi:hypothetical protein
MPDLITRQTLIDTCGLNSGVEERKLKNGIADAHRAFRKVLGRTGYDLVYATPASYTALMAYATPFLAWYAMEKSYPDLYAEADRAGVFTKSEPNSGYSSVSGRDLALKTNSARDRANEFRQELSEYLKNNPTLYPWYKTTLEGEERIDGDTKSGGGFSFRKAGKQQGYRG